MSDVVLTVINNGVTTRIHVVTISNAHKFKEKFIALGMSAEVSYPLELPARTEEEIERAVDLLDMIL